MDGDPHDIDGFPLSLSEQFRGRTMRVTNIRPQSSATQEEDWYEEQVPQHRNESTALGKDRVTSGDRSVSMPRSEPMKSGEYPLRGSVARPGQPRNKQPSGYQGPPVDTTTACIGRLPGEAFWAWAERMGSE